MAKKKKTKNANNDGSITQLDSGSYKVQISLGYNDDGTRNRPTKTFKSREEAVKWRNSILAEVDNFGSSSVVVENDKFVPAYFDWLMKIKKPTIHSKTFKKWITNYNKYIKPYFSKYNQQDIKHETFQKFFLELEKLNVGKDTRRVVKNDLHQYYEYLYANTAMRNPLKGVTYQSKNKELNSIIDPTEYYTEYKAVKKDVRDKFLKALDEDKHSPFLKPLCYLMYFVGNRIGECLPLQWKDFNFERRYFFVYKGFSREYEFDEEGNQIGQSKKIIKGPKSKKGIRPLPLIDILYEAMIEWKEKRKVQEAFLNVSLTKPDDFVFATQLGEMRSEYGTYAIFRRFLKRHNLNGCGIHFHALRQTFSNTLFSQDTEDKLITDVMGHSNISTTKRWYQSNEQFDSVSKVGKMLNELHKPVHDEFKAGEGVTFTPEGYMTEQEAIISTSNIGKQKSETISEKSAVELLEELAKIPGFQDLIKQIANQKEME